MSIQDEGVTLSIEEACKLRDMLLRVRPAVRNDASVSSDDYLASITFNAILECRIKRLEERSLTHA